jgi:3-methyladenine DNA glycosylase/8-oxoguanine DNA glycosylase
MRDAPDLVIRLPAPTPYDLRRSLSVLRMGPFDPGMRLGEDIVQLAMSTPDGDVALEARRAEHDVEVRQWGPGAEWLSSRVAALLGFDDAPEGFQPSERTVRRLWRRFAGMRLPRLPRMFSRVVQVVLLQLVTSGEGYRAWGRLVKRLGTPAPGPLELRVPPSAEVLASTPAYVLQADGVLARQARTVVRVARRADRIEEAAEAGPEPLAARLGSIPGVGPWSVQYVLGSGLGFPDALLLGDYNLPNTAAWVLAGEERGDDARLVELLEPFRGHRFRVVRLLWSSGVRAPRRGPRRPPRDLPGSGGR